MMAKKPAKAGAVRAQQPLGRSYWLFKSEPDAFSWEMQKARGEQGEPWTGVRNFMARNNMRAMKIGDLGFFYHSNVGKEIVGVVEVCALAHPDPTDNTGTWNCVDVKAVCDMPKPVTLAAVKANPKLAAMALVRSMRLSVQPVRSEEWAEVCRMGGLDPKSLRPLAGER
jgi:predicted RNA-binding protein with PUA-like domain